MDLSDLEPVAGPLGHGDRIRMFAWWLHVYGGKDHFQQIDIKECYRKLHLAVPTAFSRDFMKLVGKDLLKSAAGYRLESKARAAMESQYGQSQTTVQITQLLQGLPAKLPDVAERTYLDEALSCYKHGIFRGAVVMTWSLAFSHLCEHVLAKRLADFNAQWQATFPGMHKNKTKVIAAFDDFGDKLKESEVLTVCRDAGIIHRNVHNVLESGLKRRNAAGHPNDVSIKQLQVDAYIDDLITNAVLKIA